MPGYDIYDNSGHKVGEARESSWGPDNDDRPLRYRGKRSFNTFDLWFNLARSAIAVGVSIYLFRKGWDWLTGPNGVFGLVFFVLAVIPLLYVWLWMGHVITRRN